MARGNKIVVSADSKGKYMEGYLASAGKPGTIWQLDATVALKGGRHTFKVYQPGTDGEHPLGPYYVLLGNYMMGQPPTVAYASGDRGFFYCPRAGDELNLLLADIAGTADDHPLGEKLMVDTGTGKLIATTGSPESEVAVLKEAITDPTADMLAWCEWSGY